MEYNPQAYMSWSQDGGSLWRLFMEVVESLETGPSWKWTIVGRFSGS